MPIHTVTEQDEAAFMASLLSDDFFNTVPLSKNTPLKAKCDRVLPEDDFDIAALTEGAEDWDWGDMISPKKVSASHSEPQHYIREICTRCVVEEIQEFDTDAGYQKNLTVKLDLANDRRTVILQDDWIETDIRIGDTINILGQFSPLLPCPSSSKNLTSTITLNSTQNLLIHHPDILLTSTTISSATFCPRKPLLSSLVRPSSSSSTPSVVWGNMLHEVMQSCLVHRRWDDYWVEQRIDEVLMKGLGELIRIEVGVEEGKRELSARTIGLKAFAEKYISQIPKPEATLKTTRSTSHSTLAITQLLDVEEDIWSPTYGLKGKLDATVQAVVNAPPPASTPSSSYTYSPPGVEHPTSHPRITSTPLPFEIKTGRSTCGIEHRAQTILYTLLASERYGVNVKQGLLYYTQSEEVINVERVWNEVRGLIGVRNLLVGWMVKRLETLRIGQRNKRDERRKDEWGPEIHEKGAQPSAPFLPPTIDDERTCNRCYVLDTCMLYRKAVENVDDTTSMIANTYALKTSHLTSTQSAFFKQWEALISMEEQELFRFRKELWTMGASEREAKGRCFAGMGLDAGYPCLNRAQGVVIDEGRGGKIHRFTYAFVRRRLGGSGMGGSLLSGHMAVGDAITVSIEPDLLALARGFILELEPERVVLGVDHELGLDWVRTRVAGSASEGGTVFRIDKDELMGGMGRIRDNLAKLFYADGDTRRLELVVDLKTPRFDAYDNLSLPSVPETFNPNQREAISKVLCAQDYALVLGMPGTGKTTVIATIIKTLVGMGRTVLLTSFTHSAVDTILAKLGEGFEEKTLRLGNADKVHRDVQKYTLAAKKTATTVDQLEAQIMTPPVVATTCLSVDHPLFSRRTFDYCIVDEASQITLPTCLGPLRFADKFVLVGDHFQLPPLVKNKDARKGGLDISLFRRLSDAHPDAVVDLTHQYRMNEDIMILSNKLIYGGRLKCGSEKVAKRCLVLPDAGFLRRVHATGKGNCEGGCWMESLLSKDCKAVFVDTDAVPATESRVGDLAQNTVEASLVHQVTETLLRSGVQQDQVGIISLYRQQIKVLSSLLRSRTEVDIMTADRSQGRDKDCVIISMVKSNDSGQIGDLVKDWRRMNVSFTRARSKLIIFGSRKTLQAAPLLSEFFELMNAQKWILQLPPNADKMHTVVDANHLCKRAAEDISGKENIAVVRPSKKSKAALLDHGLLRGRPLLQDLINGQK